MNSTAATHTEGVGRLNVHLRPFRESDLDMCDRMATEPDFGGRFEWSGFGSASDLRRRWHDDGLLGASPFNLVVAAIDDDRPVGWVDWRETARAGPAVWEIGIVIDPGQRGRGAGTAAQSLLVDYLFETTPTNRVWAATEVENIAEQRALEKCGFRQEGLMRGHIFRHGAWRDSYVYGLTRDDNADRPRPH